MQTILGAGGVIANELVKVLPQYTDGIRLVSRSPKAAGGKQKAFPADMTVPEQVEKAVEGSEVTYLTVGLTYTTKIWQNTWPVIMRNVIEACRKHESKLVFFDNIYMYDRDSLDHMTEDTPIRPTSKKGEVRTEIAGMLMDAVEKGHINALIARSADFYGPATQGKSVITEIVLKNFCQGKKANWLCSVDYKHSFTYTLDAGRATAVLGNTAEAYNQVWHLPTAPHPQTGQEWIEAIAQEMLVEPKIQVATKFIVKVMGLFINPMREMYEMLYQYDRDYVFDSSKFENHFNIKPTPYAEGIKNTVQTDFNKERN